MLICWVHKYYCWSRPSRHANCVLFSSGRVQLICEGTRWRTKGAVKGKLANGVGSQCPSHCLGTRFIQHYYRWWRTPRLPVVDWTDAPSADLNGLVRFARKKKSGFLRVCRHISTGLYLALWQTTPGTDSGGSWVGCTAGLDVSVKTKICCSCRELTPQIVQPIA